MLNSPVCNYHSATDNTLLIMHAAFLRFLGAALEYITFLGSGQRFRPHIQLAAAVDNLFSGAAGVVRVQKAVDKGLIKFFFRAVQLAWARLSMRALRFFFQRNVSFERPKYLLIRLNVFKKVVFAGIRPHQSTV